MSGQDVYSSRLSINLDRWSSQRAEVRVNRIKEVALHEASSRRLGKPGHLRIVTDPTSKGEGRSRKCIDFAHANIFRFCLRGYSLLEHRWSRLSWQSSQTVFACSKREPFPEYDLPGESSLQEGC